jgi:putative ABC transport system permease protein
VLKHYLLLSLKVLLRRRFFTFISIVGISLTLLVLMVATAIMDHSWAPMAPETRQDRTLVSAQAVLYGDHPDGGSSEWCCSGGFALYDRYARGLPGVEHLSLFTGSVQVVSWVNGRKVTSHMKRTDAEYWNVLEFSFVEGRPYSRREVADGSYVAVINRTTRERLFGAGTAEGRTFAADGQRFRVVGVVEDVPFLREVPFSEIWAPYSAERNTSYRQSLMGGFHAMVLAAPGASLTEIRDEFNRRLAGISRAEFPDPQAYTTLVAPFETKFDAFARDAGPFADQKSPDPQGWRIVVAFSIIALMFVLLPTVNLVNINVSRIMERASEIGIRKAFGASSRVLVGQFIVENVVLTLVGGMVGLVLSALVLRALNDSGVIPYSTLTVNLRVFTYGLLLTLAFGVISGAYPAWRMSRLRPSEALRGARR